MAAPINAYRDGVVRVGDPNNPFDHLIAILQVDEATMKSRFYLDGLFNVKLPDGTDGVVGLVIIGGENEKMHNITTRGGVGRVTTQSQTARMLNDAGLNTLGEVVSFNPPEVMDRDNRTIDDVEFKTAYYLSGKVGIRYYQPEFGTSEIEISDFISQNNNFTRSYYLPEIFTRSEVVIYAFVQNDEGEFRTPNYYIDIDQSVIMMSYDVNPSFLLCGMIRDNPIYADTLEIGLGTMFYTDTEMTIPAKTGGYSDADYYYSYNNATGVVDMFNCADAPRRTPFTYIAYGESAEGACFLASDDEYTIYFQDIGGDRYFYKFPDGTSGILADEGYYSYLSNGVRRVLYVNEFGRMVSDMNCSDI